MKYLFCLFVLLAFLLPYTVFGVCSADGLTVVYVNGVFTSSQISADQDRDSLRDNFVAFTGRKDVKFLTGYNLSHIGGAGDLIESVSQLLGSSISNYDRNTILLQIYPEVTTRKILLVGHSQGTFYTNEIYDYLLAHGEPKEAVGVYNIATPASFVAGVSSTQLTAGGSYLTSQNDKVINAVRIAAQKIKAKQPLPANIIIPLSSKEAADSFGGHSFSGVYLTNAAARIVSEIEDELKKLVAADVSNTSDGGCFTPPPKNFSYRAQEMTFLVTDAAATGMVAVNKRVNAAGEAAYNGVLTVAQSAVKTAKTVYTNAEKLFTNALRQGPALIADYLGNTPQPSPQNQPSENAPPKAEENKEIALNQASSPSVQNNPPSSQFDKFTASQENPSAKIQNKSQEIFSKKQDITQPVNNTDTNSLPENKKPEEENKTQNIFAPFGGGGAPVGGASIILNPSSNSSATNSGNQNSSSSASQNNSSSSASTSTISSSVSSPVSHILISEVLFNASGTDVGKEFMELYNPASSSLDLTNWSLKYQKENSTATVSLASFKTSSHLEDRTAIQSKSFLLIGLNDYDSANYNGRSADIKRTGALPNGEAAGQPEKIFLVLSDASSTEIDRVTYDKNSIAKKGQSLERKSLANGACASSQNNGEFLGNGCDTDQDSDFEIRNSPNPQNSLSLAEPRSAPSIAKFKAVYNFAPRFDFSWDLSSDSTGSTSTLAYFIYDTSNPGSTKLFETSSTASSSFAYSINEVGRKYDFEFRVQDRDGFTVKLASSNSDISFSSSTDYVTLAFYDFGGGGGGIQRLALAAVDKTKYFFQNTAASQAAPTTPGNFSVNFATSTGMLNLSWSSSTDSDTLDYLIRYQVNYSTSSVLSDSNWQSAGNPFSDLIIPVFPNSYKIGVKSVDDFGNSSAPAILGWDFPAGFVSLPSQLNHGDIIGASGSGQKILISNAASISAAVLWGESEGAPFSSSQSYMEIHQDNNNSVGNLLATSAIVVISKSEGQRELIYNFSPAVSLQASSSYWLALIQDASVKTSGTRIYGTFSDSYPDGYWSSHPGSDGYFRLIQ